MSSPVDLLRVAQASAHSMSVNDLRSSLRRSQVVTNQIICSARYKRFPWCPNWDSHRTDLTLLLELWDPPTKEERLCKLDETYSAVLSADGVTLNRLLASLREGALRGPPSTVPTSQAQAPWTIDQAEQQLRALSLCALDRHDTLVGALNDELRLVARGAAFTYDATKEDSGTETKQAPDVSIRSASEVSDA